MNAWKITYWVVTAFITLGLGAGAIFDVMMAPEAVALMTQLGYPAYLNYIVGWGKILGVIVIWQKKWPRLREWAYAGLAIDTFGAGVSFLLAGLGFTASIGAFVSFGLVMLSYVAMRKVTRQ